MGKARNMPKEIFPPKHTETETKYNVISVYYNIFTVGFWSKRIFFAVTLKIKIRGTGDKKCQKESFNAGKINELY